MGSGRGQAKRVKIKATGTNQSMANALDMNPPAVNIPLAEPTILDETTFDSSVFPEEELHFGVPMMMASQKNPDKLICPYKGCGNEVEPGADECPKCHFRLNGPQLLESTFAEFEETSELLGIPIPKPDPFYIEEDPDVRRATLIAHNAISDGRRFFMISGPPSSGKNTFVKNRLAATMKMPLMEVDLSSSDEIEALIGYDGLEEKDGATITVQKRGKLTAAAERGAIIVLNEVVEVPKGQLTQIHNMVGSGVADDDRYIVIKSASNPEGQSMIKIHPDTIFVFTSNPGLNDARVHDALASRAISFHIGHGSEESQGAKLAALANKTLVQTQADIDAGKKPTPTQREWKRLRENANKPLEVSVDEVKPTVEFFNHLHKEWEEGGGDTIRHEPDFRTLTAFEVLRLKQNEREKFKELPTRIPLHQLEFMYDQSNLSPTERTRMLREVASNHFGDASIIDTVTEPYVNN